MPEHWPQRMFRNVGKWGMKTFFTRKRVIALAFVLVVGFAGFLATHRSLDSDPIPCIPMCGTPTVPFGKY